MNLTENIHTINLTETLNWRYATKRMNCGKVPAETLERILESIRLAPSSFGLQPYTILVVENKEILKRIHSSANNQPQILEASHLLIFAVWEMLTQEKIDEYINHISEVRNVPVDQLSDVKAHLESEMANTTDKIRAWHTHQAYIALGFGLIAAAMEGVDATPMDAFNPSSVDAILELREKGLRSVVMMALGYRDAEKDPIVHAKKVRRDKEKLFIHVS